MKSPSTLYGDFRVGVPNLAIRVFISQYVISNSKNVEEVKFPFPSITTLPVPGLILSE